MLEYLSGIGAPRKGRGIFKKKMQTVKGKIHKMPLPLAAKQIQAAKKISPLAAAKMQKAFVQEKIRRAHEKSANPFMLKKEPTLVTDLQEFEDAYLIDGQNEVNEPEFSTDSDELGIIYPGVEISGKRGRARREEKRALKKEKKMSKVELRRSKADAKRLKAEGKRLKGEGKRLKGESGGGDFKEYLTQGLDTVKSVFGKGGGAASSESESSENLNMRTGKPDGQQTFFEEYKMPILLGGAGLAALLILPKVLKK